MGRVDKKRQAEAERQVDEIIAIDGRDPKSFLTEGERTQLMGIAMRWAMWWGVGFGFMTGIVWIWQRLDDGVWPADGWLRPTYPLIVFVAAFFYKRRQMLDRVAEIWKPKRDEMLRDILSRIK